MGVNGIELSTFVWFTSGFLTLDGWFLFSHNIYLSISFIANHYITTYSPREKKMMDYSMPVRTDVSELDFFSSNIIFKVKHARYHVEFMKIMDAICGCSKAF
jgi:hypothetical protein